MFFSVNPDISFPCETLLFTVVEDASDLGLCLTGHVSHIVGAKEMVKKEHISVPSIPGPQSSFDIDKTRMFATNIGHDVPNLAPVIHKGSSRVWRSCCHFLIRSLIIFSRIFSFRYDGNIWVNSIIQSSPSDTILRGKGLFDLLWGPWPIFVIDIRFFSGLLETNFMTLLVAITADQNQVDCIGNRLMLNPFHMFQIVYTKFQVSHCSYGDRYPIVT
jgi:hypothetical protein